MRDSAGQHMFGRVKDTSAKDDKTFVISFKEPYPLILDAFAKPGTPDLFIMRTSHPAWPKSMGMIYLIVQRG